MLSDGGGDDAGDWTCNDQNKWESFSSPTRRADLPDRCRLTRLFMSFSGGRTVGDVLLTDMELLELIDHRKFCSFGVTSGLLRRQFKHLALIKSYPDHRNIPVAQLVAPREDLTIAPSIPAGGTGVGNGSGGTNGCAAAAAAAGGDAMVVVKGEVDEEDGNSGVGGAGVRSGGGGGGAVSSIRVDSGSDLSVASAAVVDLSSGEVLSTPGRVSPPSSSKRERGLGARYTVAEVQALLAGLPTEEAVCCHLECSPDELEDFVTSDGVHELLKLDCA